MATPGVAPQIEYKSLPPKNSFLDGPPQFGTYIVGMTLDNRTALDLIGIAKNFGWGATFP
jgi:hypothetical protein